MMRATFLVILFCLIASETASVGHAQPVVSEYRYSDGSGNMYIITPLAHGAQVEYRPVQLQESSSGTYSGGLSVTKNINPHQYHQIRTLFAATARRTAHHIHERRMGSGAVTITTAGHHQQFILAAESPEKHQLENLLSSLVQQTNRGGPS